MEIIQLTGNKAEFSNYINDPIVLKEDSKVCLNKASFSIPVMVNRDIYFPKAADGIANYDATFFFVILNGIEKPITYQNFFDAYDALDLLANPTIAEFYSGVFNTYVDNLAVYVADDGTNYDVPSFSDVVAKACDTLFSYYEFFTQNKTEITNLGSYEQNVNLVIGGNNVKKIKDNRSITEFGLIAQYEPSKMTESTSTPVAWAAANVDNFTPNGDGIVSVDANPSMAVCPNTFDPNGGYIAATPQIGAGKAALGLIFVSKGHNDPLNITGVYQPENFDVGIEYELLGSGERVLQIIDGNQKFVYYDVAASAEVITVKPNYVPPNQIYTWDHNVDKFWFLVRKGRPMNGTTEFTTTIIQGPGTTPQDSLNRIIYVSKKTLNTSQIETQTLAYSLGAGNGFDNWEFIPVSDDSMREDDYLLSPTTDRDGIQGTQIFQIQPNIDNTDYENERTFWDNIGITQINFNLNVNQGTNKGWNATMSWKLSKNIEKSFWIGTKSFGDIIAPEIAFAILPNYSSSLKVSTIPREINVSIMDLPITPNVGSFIGANNEFTSGSINKVVNYVQTDSSQLDLDTNSTLDYVYEAFNLVYRKMNNQGKMPITQMKIKLSYKDFTTNNEQLIPSMDGIVKLELLFD